MSKMNVLHWHVSDASSMPFHMQKYPKLAEKGGFTPEATYSVVDVDEITQYAKHRGIRVILEFDMPGHNYAWSLALPNLFVNCTDMHPIETQSWKGSFNPTLESVYEFLDGFIGEIAKRQTEKVLHLGGDEVQYKCWNESESIRSYMRKHNLNLTQLYGVFEERAHKIAKKYNLTIQSWDEVYSTAKDALPNDAIVQVWRSNLTLKSSILDGFRSILSKGYYLNLGFDMGVCKPGSFSAILCLQFFRVFCLNFSLISQY